MGHTLGHVLVTGAAGQLGSSVVRRLRQRGVGVTALVLEPADGLDVDRVVVGDAGDPEVARDAVQGADAIVHLAAIRSPRLATPEEVFCGNTAATFTILEQGAQAGVRRAVLASSYSVTGLPFSPGLRHPAYVPLDQHVPLQVEDPYALSKQVDELSAALMWWTHGMTVTCLRYPYLGTAGAGLRERLERNTEDPSVGARELWTYLDVEDAARATELALTEPPEGTHVVPLAAPTTIAPYPTEQLLDAYHPNVPRRRPLPGRTVPVDLSHARQLLGFTPENVMTCDERDLDVVGGGA
ncbi:MAG: NAD-dependent epimerase/dehydratase [Nocardioides sp.]|nr:NAD-dependent epimerase/dehydratase [Nocardioides sp.]